MSGADLPPLEELLSKYRDGELVGELNALTKPERRRLYRVMLAGLGDEKYRELVTDCLVARVAESDEKLEAARDPVAVSRSREQARFARMDLERRRPALYGPKQEVSHTGALPSFTVVLLDRPSEPKELDVSPVPALSEPEVAGQEVQGEENGVRKG